MLVCNTNLPISGDRSPFPTQQQLCYVASEWEIVATPDGSSGMHLAPETLDDLDPRVAVADYDRDALARSIVHIGVGGFHRAHLAAYVDELARAGHTDVD